MDNGGVYIIGTMDGPKKIGMSGNFQQRLAHIRHGMPYRVFLLEEWAMDRVVAYAVEKIAHAMLWDDHYERRSGSTSICQRQAGALIEHAI